MPQRTHRRSSGSVVSDNHWQIAVERLGPLRLVTFAGGRGFVTYQDLGGADAVTIAGWVRVALAHYRADAAITRVEWKTRGHDRAPGLHDALVSGGFAPGQPESIMIGEARRPAAAVALPDEAALRVVTSEPDVRAMCAMQAEVFGGSSRSPGPSSPGSGAGPRGRGGGAGGSTGP
jgi:hypothetical protein